MISGRRVAEFVIMQTPSLSNTRSPNVTLGDVTESVKQYLKPLLRIKLMPAKT